MHNLIIVVFCLGLVLTQAFGSTIEKVKTETYKDIISKAQLLLLQKDRLQAVNILIMAIQKEDPKGLPYSELKKTLNKVAQIFLNENAQSEYELALSIDKTDRKGAIEKLNDVLKIEPQNSQILKNLIAMNLALKKCSQALTQFESLLVVNPLDIQIPFLDIAVSVCFKNTNKYKEQKKKYEVLAQIPLEFWYINDNRIQLPSEERLSEFVFAIDHISKVNPEVLYFKAQSEQTTIKDRNNLTKEYIKRCKLHKNNFMINNYIDPWVCENLGLVQDDEKNNKI